MNENTQKLDAVIDVNLPDDLDYASVFSKIIYHKLSDGYIWDLYSRWRMNIENDSIQTQDPQFMGLGIPYINTLNENGVLGTCTTNIRRPKVKP